MDCSREKILKSCARVRLIEGEPGVGKTWFGCELAQYELDNPTLGVQPHQKILFLTFARNAVARIRQVFKKQVLADDKKAKAFAERVRVDTFWGFFWWLAECYGRYTKDGTTKRLWLIGSKDIPGTRLPQRHEGFTFDKIEASALTLVRISPIQQLISAIYPLIIVDEFQDVDGRLLGIIEALGRSSRLVLLRGPGQCIYRTLPGKPFDPNEILTCCRDRLRPVEFVLKSAGIARQRYSRELTEFLNGFDANKVAPPTRTWPVRFAAIEKINRQNVLDVCAGVLVGRMRAYLRNQGRPKPRVSILASTNQAVAEIHRQIITGHAGLTMKGRFVRLPRGNASLLFGDNLLLQYGRLILALLGTHWIAEDKAKVNSEAVAVQLATLFQEQKKDIDIRHSSWQAAADLLRDKAGGQRKPHDPSDWEQRLRRNLSIFNSLLRGTSEDLQSAGVTGCPNTPFDASDTPLLSTLTEEFINSIRDSVDGQGRLDMERATIAFEKANQQRVIFEKLGIEKNVQVMTIHKSKGREFDGVVLVLENSHKAIWREASSARDEEIEDLYRVAISRARSAFALVAFEDAWNDAARPVRKLLPETLFRKDT